MALFGFENPAEEKEYKKEPKVWFHFIDEFNEIRATWNERSEEFRQYWNQWNINRTFSINPTLLPFVNMIISFTLTNKEHHDFFNSVMYTFKKFPRVDWKTRKLCYPPSSEKIKMEDEELFKSNISKYFERSNRDFDEIMKFLPEEEMIKINDFYREGKEQKTKKKK